MSRVSRVKHGTTAVAKYRYNGLDMVVGTDYPEPDVYSNLYSSSGAYDRLDRFDRVVTNLWRVDRSTDRDFVKLALAYDRNSNITLVDDQLHKDSGTGNGVWDAAYGMDNLNRLISAREGHWDGTEITTGNRKFEQLWTLGQTGNWGRAKIDYNGDGDYADTTGLGGAVTESDDTRAHSDANEITTRDTDSNAGTTGNNYTLVYNKRGDLTSDGQAYKFKYDAGGRLKEIRNQSDVLLAEYLYNGLGYRIGWHYDVDGDLTVENTADDPWYYFVYDTRWRMVASVRGSDTYDPDGGGPLPTTHAFKEQWVYNNAGLNGLGGGAGGSSYIDSVIMRDRDNSNGWSGAGDGTLEERRVLIQNWRADVVAVLRAATGTSGGIVEHVRYTAYGEPRCIQAGDLDYDGDVDSTDQTTFNTINGGTYDYLGDLNLDGADDSSDSTQFTTEKNLTLTCGRGVTSRTDTRNRKGYAGYEGDGGLVRFSHVRYRVLDVSLGRWTRRDPAGYLDGLGLSRYAAVSPIVFCDNVGMQPVRPLPRVTPRPVREFPHRSPGRPGKPGRRRQEEEAPTYEPVPFTPVHWPAEVPFPYAPSEVLPGIPLWVPAGPFSPEEERPQFVDPSLPLKPQFRRPVEVPITEPLPPIPVWTPIEVPEPEVDPNAPLGPPRPPRNYDRGQRCQDWYLDYLEEAKRAVCNQGGCSGGMGCDELEAKKQAAWNCLTLRLQICEECYPDGCDEGHEKQIRQAHQVWRMCIFHEGMRGCHTAPLPPTWMPGQ